MKKIFLVFGIAGFHTASAQQNDIFNPEEYLRKKKDRFAAAPVMISPFLSTKQLNAATTTIVTLPADNMPCVKVDMSLFTQMPNVAAATIPLLTLLNGGSKPGEIPNVAPEVKQYYFSR